MPYRTQSSRTMKHAVPNLTLPRYMPDHILSFRTEIRAQPIRPCPIRETSRIQPSLSWTQADSLRTGSRDIPSHYRPFQIKTPAGTCRVDPKNKPDLSRSDHTPKLARSNRFAPGHKPKWFYSIQIKKHAESGQASPSPETIPPKSFQTKKQAGSYHSSPYQKTSLALPNRAINRAESVRTEKHADSNQYAPGNMPL